MRYIVQWFGRHTLVFFALLIILAIFYWLLKFQKQLNIKWQEALIVSLVHVIVGWSCMRLLAIIEVGGNMEKAANMRLYGAVFILPLIYYLWSRLSKRNVALVMDVASICVIFGAISGRLNCFTNGCCQGLPVWSGGAYRWPIREAELVFYFIFILIFCRKIIKKQTYGQVYPIYLISYGAVRFFCECVREEYTTQIGIFHLAHIWSLISIMVGSVMLYMVYKNNESGFTRRKKVGSNSKKLNKEGGK